MALEGRDLQTRLTYPLVMLEPHNKPTDRLLLCSPIFQMKKLTDEETDVQREAMTHRVYCMNRSTRICAQTICLLAQRSSVPHREAD